MPSIHDRPRSMTTGLKSKKGWWDSCLDIGRESILQWCCRQYTFYQNASHTYYTRRAARIELASIARKGHGLPLNYARAMLWSIQHNKKNSLETLEKINEIVVPWKYSLSLPGVKQKTKKSIANHIPVTSNKITNHLLSLDKFLLWLSFQLRLQKKNILNPETAELFLKNPGNCWKCKIKVSGWHNATSSPRWHTFRTLLLSVERAGLSTFL